MNPNETNNQPDQPEVVTDSPTDQPLQPPVPTPPINTQQPQQPAPQYAAAQPQPYQQYQQQPGSSALAITSMVLSIVGLLTVLILIGGPIGLVGLILGIVALVKKQPGKGMAIAGVVVGAIATAIGMLILIAFLVVPKDLLDEGVRQEMRQRDAARQYSSIIISSSLNK